MLTISRDSDLFTAMIFIEVSPDKQREMFEVNVSATEKIERLPGFVAAAFHNSLDGTMLTEYVQWENEDFFRRAFDAPAFYEHLPEIDRLAEHVESGPYEVRRIDVARADRAGADTTEGRIDVSRGRDVATAVTRYRVEPGNLRALLGLLGEQPEHPLSGLPGFVGAALLEGRGGDRVVEYLRFANEEQLEAAKRSPQARAHEAKARKLARADARLYGVDHVSPSASRPPPSAPPSGGPTRAPST